MNNSLLEKFGKGKRKKTFDLFYFSVLNVTTINNDKWFLLVIHFFNNFNMHDVSITSLNYFYIILYFILLNELN